MEGQRWVAFRPDCDPNATMCIMFGQIFLQKDRSDSESLSFAATITTNTAFLPKYFVTSVPFNKRNEPQHIASIHRAWRLLLNASIKISLVNGRPECNCGDVRTIAAAFQLKRGSRSC